MKQPNSLQERQQEATRLSNHHILTCSNKGCKYLKEDPQPKKDRKDQTTKQHDSDKLYKAVIKYSKAVYPLGEDEQWKSLTLDPSVFYINREYKATLKIKIPTQTLNELANLAEEYTCKANKVKTNIKRRNYYFY